nr:uncharacterized protein LOC124818105 [Hydra vulgaris]
MIIDSGSSVNLIDKNTFKKIRSNNPNLIIKKSSTTIFPYVLKPLKLIGCFKAEIEAKNKITTNNIYIVDKNKVGNIMGIETAKELNILKIAESVKFVNNKEHYMNSVDNKSIEAVQHSNVCKNIDDKIKLPTNQNDNSFEHIDSNCKVTLKFKNNLTKLIAKYEDIFEGHGKLKNFQCKLYVDKNIQPVAQNLRRYPYHLRKDIRAELKRLQEADIIEKVERPQE